MDFRRTTEPALPAHRILTDIILQIRPEENDQMANKERVGRVLDEQIGQVAFSTEVDHSAIEIAIQQIRQLVEEVHFNSVN